MERLEKHYIPSQFRSIVAEGVPVKFFAPDELNRLGRIFDYVRRDGIAVLSGSWEKILELNEYFERKKGELGEHHKKDYTPRHKRNRDNRFALYRLMIAADGEVFQKVQPPFRIPYLLEFLDDRFDANRGREILVPLLAILKLQKELKQLYPVWALGSSILAPGNVLPPRSQETVNLIGKGLEKVKGKLPAGAEVLDMGCGSGCLSLLAAETLRGREVKVTATDSMPDALAATKLNVNRFVEEGKIPPGIIEVTSGGDLFDPVAEKGFDLIIFNAPWVVSRPSTRADAATHDEGQDTVERFLAQAGEHLKGEGNIILAYSDNSGQTAIDNLEDTIRKAGFKIESLLKERIQARRGGRRWEKVLVYILYLKR